MQFYRFEVWMSEQKFNRKNIVVTGRVSYSQIQCFLIFFFLIFSILNQKWS